MSNRLVTSRKRHLLKTITWRIVGTIDTIVLTWLVTGELKTGLTVGGIETVSKMILYYLHERVWFRTRFGLSDDK